METEKLDNLSHKEALSKITRIINSFVPFYLLGGYLCYIYFPWTIPDLPNSVDRMVYTLQWHTLSVAILFRMQENVMLTRSKHAWNPLDPKTQKNTDVLGRILTNTVEQFLIFVFSSTILSTYLKPSKMHMIPILIIMWSIARVLFEYGYKIHPLYRAAGFTSTLFVALISTTLVTYYQYIQGNWLLALLGGYCIVRRFMAIPQVLLFGEIV